MLLYRIAGGFAALVVSFTIDMIIWGSPLLSIGVACVLAALCCYWLDDFYAWLFSGLADPDLERKVARLDRAFLKFHFWWKRRLVEFRRHLRRLLLPNTG